jgi:hypothetical protein
MTVLCMDEKRASPFSPGMVKSGNQGSGALGSCPNKMSSQESNHGGNELLTVISLKLFHVSCIVVHLIKPCPMFPTNHYYKYYICLFAQS